MTTTIDYDRLTKVFVKLRDARADLKRDWERQDKELEEKQKTIEAAMLGYLNETNCDSVKTPHGTFYRQEDIIPTGADWDAFYEWVKDHDAFDALERRIKKNFIAEYMATHEGGTPPGVSVFRKYVVRVRRNNS